MSVPLKERLIFSHTVEGLFLKALAPRLTPRLYERLAKEAGVELRKRLDPGYPMHVWEHCVTIAAEELHPELPQPEAFELLGAALTQGYFDTLIGSAMAAMLRLIGPARSIKRIERSLRSGNNYSESTLAELGPRHFTIWTNEVGPLRENMRGILRRGMEIAGAANVRCVVTHFDAQSVTYDIAWDA